MKEIKTGHEIFRRKGSIKITGFAKTSAPINNFFEHNNGVNFKCLSYFSPLVGFS